jgi:hypothetical protein
VVGLANMVPTQQVIVVEVMANLKKQVVMIMFVLVGKFVIKMIK